MKSIELKTLIREEILSDKIEKEIDELGKLQSEIDELKQQLQPLEKKQKKLVGTILPVIEELDTETIKTKTYVFKIIKKSFDRKTYQYKEGFLKSLEKVNENTKKILKKILEQTEKITKVKPQFQISPIWEGLMDTLISTIKKVIRKLIPSLKKIKSENNKLRKMV